MRRESGPWIDRKRRRVREIGCFQLLLDLGLLVGRQVARDLRREVRRGGPAPGLGLHPVPCPVGEVDGLLGRKHVPFLGAAQRAVEVEQQGLVGVV